MDVSWPSSTGPSRERNRHRRPAELWELRPESEAWVGERALADLVPDTERTDALLILARYLTLRVAAHIGQPDAGTFNAGAERSTAREYLDALDDDIPEGRWLYAILGSSTTRVSRALVSRLNAAATAASRRGHVNGAFALRSTAYEVATRNGWDIEAGRVARAMAAAADRGGGRRSRSLWNRRARVHERRANTRS